jgi:hypothetical protein
MPDGLEIPMGQPEKDFMTSSPDAFTIPEAEVCSRLGITRDELRSVRGVDGKFWKKAARGSFLWSESGIAEAARQLAQKTPGATPGVTEGIPNGMEKKRFTVARVRTPWVLHVIEPGKKYDARNPVSLWVPKKMALWFRPGMPVAGTERAGSDGRIYDLAGNPDRPDGRRLPRKPGHW